jgi:hypothetical protein
VIYEGKDGILINPEEGKIKFESLVQRTPNIITFVDLNTVNPKIKGNNGQADLAIIYNNDDQIVLVEKDILDVGTFHNFTIFKKEGIAIWNKQYKLVSSPYGFVSMGYCE